MQKNHIVSYPILHKCILCCHITRYYLSSAELRDEVPSSLGPAAATVATGLRRMQRGLGGLGGCRRAILRLADGSGAILRLAVLGEVEAVGGGEDVGEGARSAEGRLQLTGN